MVRNVSPSVKVQLLRLRNSPISPSVKDVANLQCWLATIPVPQLDARGVRVDRDAKALSVSRFAASVTDALLNISCIECSGPRMPELTSLFASSDGSQAFVNFTNGVFDFVSELIEGSFMQVTLDRALNDARKKCPHSVEYEPNFNGFKYESFEQQDNEGTVTFLVAMLVVALILFVAVLAVAIATRLFVRRRHRKWVTSLPRTQLQLLWKEQNKQDEKNAALNEATTSMFNSSALPKWSRWGIPIILLMNIGFFLSGHLSLGASVVILASIGGETFTEDGFFEISIAKSTVKIWEGKSMRR